MGLINEGDKAPDFTLPCDTGELYTLSQHLSRTPLIVYFYPKDMTSGCTQEACDFRDMLLTQSHFQVVGISKDSVKSHKKFKEQYTLTFPLLSDASGEVCSKYGVWIQKSMYGRKYFGIERSTFIINEHGVVLKIWRKVTVKNHRIDILKFLVSLHEGSES